MGNQEPKQIAVSHVKQMTRIVKIPEELCRLTDFERLEVLGNCGVGSQRTD